MRHSAVGLSFAVTCLAGVTPSFAMTYTAQEHDTFWSLARRFHTTVSALEKANPKVDPLNIYPGLKLNIPGSAPRKTSTKAKSAKASPVQKVLYTVQPRDTLWSIAVRHHVTVAAIVKCNPGVDAMHLRPGQRLVLPGGAAGSQQSAGTQKVKALAAQLVKTHVSLSGRSGSQAVVSDGPVVPGPNGQPLPYAKAIDAVATAYTAHDNGVYGARDYFGHPLQFGTISVDPHVIPLGSTLYITGYHFPGLPADGFIGHATDEGGAIIGNRIDIYLPVSTQEALQFGVQHVKVYVLK